MDPLKTTLLSVDARVCVPGRGTDDAALVLQIQNWTQFDSEVEDDVIVDVLRRMEVCNHTSVGDAPEGGDTTTTTEGWGFGHGIDHISEHLSCPDCDAEYQFSLRDCGVHGRAFLITTWVDLGAGLDVEDLKWKKMISGFPDGQIPKFSSEVSKMFQEASRLQQRDSDPTDLNQAILIGSRYRRSLRSFHRFLYQLLPLSRH